MVSFYMLCCVRTCRAGCQLQHTFCHTPSASSQRPPLMGTASHTSQHHHPVEHVFLWRYHRCLHYSVCAYAGHSGLMAQWKCKLPSSKAVSNNIFPFAVIHTKPGDLGGQCIVASLFRTSSVYSSRIGLGFADAL